MMDPNSAFTFVQYLLQIFEQRKNRNRRYSLRAFARDLGLSPGKLSEILSKKYVPGPLIVKRICDSLQLTEQECVQVNQMAKEHEALLSKFADAHVLQEDELALIVNYQYYALMSLLETKNFNSDSVWISKRLGLSEDEVFEILDRLVRLGLIEFSHGQYRLTHKKVTTTHCVPSNALKEAHRHLIDHARECITNVALEHRDITSITFPVDASRVAEAKVAVRDFRRKMAEFFAEGNTNEVYNLNIQLVPVTKPIGEVL